MVPPLHGKMYVLSRGVEALPADDHPMIERNKPDSLSDLDDRLRRVREKEEGNRPAAKWDDDTRGALGIAVRIGVELVAAVGIGAGIGFFLDRWLGTPPWFLVVFFLLGSAAGMMNVYRVMVGMSGAVGYSAERKSAEDSTDKDSAKQEMNEKGTVGNESGDDDDAPRKA